MRYAAEFRDTRNAEAARTRNAAQAVANAEAARRADEERVAENQVEIRAKRFLVENLTSCFTVYWPISNVRIEAKLTFSIETDPKRFHEVQVDLRGSSLVRKNDSLELACGAGNCIRRSFSTRSDNYLHLECGAQGTAASVARAFETYVGKLPKPPTF